jgi:thiol-disulfide isomerase/thioredoxin
MKKSNQPILLYVILGLLVVAIAIGPIYSAFAEPSFGEGYDDHPKIMDFSNIDELGQDSTDLIYRFHPDCGACARIKSQVIDFAESNEQDLTVYMTHIDYEENLPPGYYTGTPTLLVVEDGEIVDEITGATDIPLFFDDVNSGAYEVK